MNILITGSSGLIGTALFDSMTSSGHNVYRMLRNTSSDEPFTWSPSENIMKYDESISIDAVIHLAGAGIADGRWSKARKKAILESREAGTRLLSDTLAKLNKKPKVLISCSAIGFYGSTGGEIIDESSESGSDFLADVCQKWEDASRLASDAGIRTANIRLGVVLSTVGGALQKMLLPFKLGLGGKIGSGAQYMSWVSITDVTNMVHFIIDNEAVSGAVNIVSSNPVTNYTFTKSLGAALNRPTFFPLPAFIARLIFGEMADALLLSSTRVVPKKLKDAGYEFINDDLEKTFRSLLINKQ